MESDGSGLPRESFRIRRFYREMERLPCFIPANNFLAT